MSDRMACCLGAIGLLFVLAFYIQVGVIVSDASAARFAFYCPHGVRPSFLRPVEIVVWPLTVPLWLVQNIAPANQQYVCDRFGSEP